MRAGVKITPREKRQHAACRLFSREVIFTRAHVSRALLSLRKNGGLLVVYQLLNIVIPIISSFRTPGSLTSVNLKKAGMASQNIVMKKQMLL